MDKARHPHVIRTWVVERTRHLTPPIPTLHEPKPRKPRRKREVSQPENPAHPPTES